MTARQWLRANGYASVADTIDEILAEWRVAGNRQRRNWWQVLTGRKDGSPVVVADRSFPVLVAAQRRQHVKVSKNALKNKRREKAPPVRVSNRWPQPAVLRVCVVQLHAHKSGAATPRADPSWEGELRPTAARCIRTSSSVGRLAAIAVLMHAGRTDCSVASAAPSLGSHTTTP